MFYVHYLDSTGNQAYTGPHCDYREATISVGEVQSAGGRSATIVRDWSDSVLAEDFEG